MDVFKLTIDTSVIHKITNRADFENLTEKRKPWVDYERTPEGRKTRHFAVCPHCHNAIVMIGFNDGSQVKTPYARHYLARELWHLGTVRDKDAYDACPYHRKGKSSFTPDDKFPKVSEKSIKLISKLIDNFDFIITMLQEAIGIEFSQTCIRKMLEAYQASDGWLYKGASEQNLPWAFAYLTLSHSLYGQTIHNESIRKALLKKNAKLVFKQNRFIPTKGVYLSALFCFLEHRRNVINHHLTESLTFSISTSTKEVLHTHQIQWESIDFDAYLMLHKDDKRCSELIDLAREHLGYLIR